MAGVREKKKEALRQQILGAAKECFLTDGFEETTIADIAARANIGVGTLYNYFPSKALLYVQSYYRDMGNPKEKLDEVIRRYGDDPSLTIIHIIEIYLEPYRTFERNQLRELFCVFIDSLNKHHELGVFYTASKFMFIDFITKILKAYQDKGMLSSSIDTNDGAFCIYSIISTQALFFTMNDTISYETMQQNILRQTQLFLNDKIKRRGGRK